MKKYFILLLCAIFAFACSSEKEQATEPLSENASYFEKIIYSLTKDGYEFSHDKFKSLSFLRCADSIEETDYYAMQYKCHGMIEFAKINQKRNFYSKKEINDILLGNVQSIKAIIMRKHFGGVFSYDNADIKVEEWNFPNKEIAQKASIEIKRIRSFLIGKPCGHIIQESNNVYMFTISQPATKCEELERLFKKATES